MFDKNAYFKKPIRCIKYMVALNLYPDTGLNCGGWKHFKFSPLAMKGLRESGPLKAIG